MMANIDEKTGASATLKLSGRFDFDSFSSFRDSYAPCLESAQVREIVIDMGAVEYMDSAALGMLLLLKEKAKQVGKSVSLCNCRGMVRDILEIAHFDDLFVMR